MLTLCKKEDRYFINHDQGGSHATTTCHFHQARLPESTRQHLQSLPITNDPAANTYLLNDRQERELACIMKKIGQERNSGYLFSGHLQQTYLVELVHFITKIHYASVTG